MNRTKIAVTILMVMGYCTMESVVESSKKLTDVENCLIDYFHVDQQTAGLIKDWLNPLLSNEEYHPILDVFIEKSKNLNIQFTSIPSYELSPDDAVIKAPQWHQILFESPHVRILVGVVKSGECVPFHTHQWERLMIVIQEGQFKSETLQGTIEFDDIPIGVYQSQEEDSPSSSINIGDTTFAALVFEVKK